MLHYTILYNYLIKYYELYTKVKGNNNNNEHVALLLGVCALLNNV